MILRRYIIEDKTTIEPEIISSLFNRLFVMEFSRELVGRVTSSYITNFDTSMENMGYVPTINHFISTIFKDIVKTNKQPASKVEYM